MSLSRNLCPLCCNPCVQCCCPHLLSDKYSRVQYKKASKGAGSQLFQSPIKVLADRAFVFRQPKTEYSVIPSLSDDEVISEQPKLHFEPSLQVSESGSPSTESLPTLEFSLFFDIQKNMLTVRVQQAYNLQALAKGVECNSCVVAYLTPNKLEVFESQVVQKCANPVYDQVFHFSNLSGPDLLRKQTLVFRILEYTRSRDLVGVVIVPLADADLYGVSTKLEIEKVSTADRARDNSCGDILVSLMYRSSKSSIEGVVLRVANLRGADLTGTRDPYVKVHLCNKGNYHSKWESSIKKQSLNPIFKERFHFDISKLSLEDITLQFLVMDHDRFSRDSVIGAVILGSDIGEDQCKAHWEEVVESPNNAVSRWHKIARQTHRPRSHTL